MVFIEDLLYTINLLQATVFNARRRCLGKRRSRDYESVGVVTIFPCEGVFISFLHESGCLRLDIVEVVNACVCSKRECVLAGLTGFEAKQCSFQVRQGD